MYLADLLEKREPQAGGFVPSKGKAKLKHKYRGVKLAKSSFKKSLIKLRAQAANSICISQLEALVITNPWQAYQTYKLQEQQANKKVLKTIKLNLNKLK